MSAAISSLRDARMSPARRITSPRSGAGVARQISNPRLADATARLTSSAVESGNVPTTSFVSAGLTLSKVSPFDEATHLPAMKFWKTLVIERFDSERLQTADFRLQGSAKFQRCGLSLKTTL